MRYTEYHAGKAVIKDKSKLSEAMEKLAKLEDEEESKDFALSKNEDGTFSVYEKPYATVDCATKENFEYLKDAVEYYRNKEETSKWIPCSERLPESGEYVLVSFENDGIILPDMATYQVDQDGNGAFCASDDFVTYASVGLYVNAWMPLPEPYKEN